MPNKRKLKRVDLDLFIRFLNVISETSPVGLTALQRKTGTNHTACIKYVTLLEKLELAKWVKENNRILSITERGREALKVLSVYFQ